MNRNEEWLGSAVEALEEGDFATALGWLDRITPEFDQYRFTQLEKLACLLQLGRYEEVLERFKEVPMDDPEVVEMASVNLLFALSHLKQFERVLEECKKLGLARDHEIYPTVMSHAWDAAVGLGSDPVLEEVGLAILSGRELLFNQNIPIGQVYEELSGVAGRKNDESLKEKYQMEKASWENLFQGVKALGEGRYEEAAASYGKVPAQSSHFAQSIADAIGALVNLDREAEAIELAKQMPKESDLYPVALANVQAALNNLKRYDEALAAFAEIPETVHFYPIALENGIISLSPQQA